VRESTHPVVQVGRDLGIPDNVLYPLISQHLLAEAHVTTRAYELTVESGCREGCTLLTSSVSFDTTYRLSEPSSGPLRLDGP
jgi:hypothetical protein